MLGTFLAPRTAPCPPLHASRGRGSRVTSPSGASSCVVGQGGYLGRAPCCSSRSEPTAPGNLLRRGPLPLSSVTGSPHCRALGRGSRAPKDSTGTSLGKRSRSRNPEPFLLLPPKALAFSPADTRTRTRPEPLAPSFQLLRPHPASNPASPGGKQEGRQVPQTSNMAQPLLARPRPHFQAPPPADLRPSPLPLQAPGSRQRRCWLSGPAQRSGSPAHGLPVSGSKQRRWRCCSEASRGAEVGGRPAGSWGHRSSKAALEAGARTLAGRQGPQGDHSDQPLRGRRPRTDSVWAPSQRPSPRPRDPGAEGGRGSGYHQED